MRFKLDENIPFDLFATLASDWDIDTMKSEGLSGQNDDIVWAAAQADNRFLITQDLDFSDVRRFKPGTRYGLLLLRLHNPSRSAVCQKLVEILRSPDIQTWQNCFVVATDSKIRVLRPTLH